MKPLPFLLNQISEECSEIVKVNSKIVRFGIDSVKPGDEKTNRQKLVEEINDLEACVRLLKEWLDDPSSEGGGLPGLGDEDFIKGRMDQFMKWAEVSRKGGLLESGLCPTSVDLPPAEQITGTNAA